MKRFRFDLAPLPLWVMVGVLLGMVGYAVWVAPRDHLQRAIDRVNHTLG